MLETVLRGGKQLGLKPSHSYYGGDGYPAHCSSTATGATLFIVD
jgi:hypothetical protein